MSVFDDRGLWRRNLRRIHELRGRFSGEQCVLICTGPSVARVDLRQLEDHPYVMGMNGSYLLRNHLHSYFAANPAFLQDNVDRIARIATQRIFTRPESLQICLDAGIAEERLIIFDGSSSEVSTEISTDLTAPLPFGPTALLTIALPAVIWCGFEQVILIGADFPQRGYRRFHAGRPDAPRQRPHPVSSYEAEMQIGRFRASLWAEHLRRHHPRVEVLNCSPGSELEAFPRVELAGAVRTYR